MKSKIERKVHEIAEYIFNSLQNNALDLSDLGLLSGRLGTIIFCFHYLDVYPDPHRSKILNTYLDSYFDKLTSGIELPTYCSGLAGIMDGLRYLNTAGYLDVDYSDIEKCYVRVLQDFALNSIANMNYDFLHGGLGVIKYFYNDASFVNEALALLEEKAEKTCDTYKWSSLNGMDNTISYNISLSHGISSIIAVISQLTVEGINSKRDRIISKACNYILSQKIDSKKYGCHFPSTSLEDNSNKITTSRLAWCYGDLGVAISLWKAGKILNNRDLINNAIDVFSFSATRRSKQTSFVVDGGICHGTAGLAMIFDYLYVETERKLFQETRDFWLDETIDIGNNSDGLAGYKVWHGNEKGWEVETNLLEGISGIGLMLLTVLSSTRNYYWMNFLMLDFSGK